jgi:hypothetical protein
MELPTKQIPPSQPRHSPSIVPSASLFHPLTPRATALFASRSSISRTETFDLALVDTRYASFASTTFGRT